VQDPMILGRVQELVEALTEACHAKKEWPGLTMAYKECCVHLKILLNL
jgi:hypothetical protein